MPKLRQCVDAFGKTALFVCGGVDVHNAFGDGAVKNLGNFSEKFGCGGFITCVDSGVEFLEGGLYLAHRATVFKILLFVDDNAFLCGFDIRHGSTPL